MAVFYNAKGKLEIVPHEKKTYQGCSKNTKYSRRSNSSRKKRYRGQGK